MRQAASFRTLKLQSAFAFAMAALLVACAPIEKPIAPKPKPPNPSIVSVQEWGGLALVQPPTAQRITHITLHHQGETWRKGGDVAAYLQRLQTWSRVTKQWADIPYHYVIAPEGRIYAARPLGLAGDTNTEYDPSGHVLVMLLGNFEEVEPTQPQLLATAELMAWLVQQNGLGASDLARTIASHKDYSAQTVCPGGKLYRYLESGWLHAAVKARLNGLPADSANWPLPPPPAL